MSMVPLKFPPFPDHDEFSIFAALKPAREVGGDFYDFYFLDEERLCICIGDVSGKGVPAALFMAMAKTLIKSRADDDHSTASILTHTNDELSTDNASSMFVTIFIAIINIKTGQLLFTNAGHDPPFIKRIDGTLRKLDQRHGPVVGAIEGMAYKEDMDIMAPGDLLIIFTDGVTEAMDIEGQLFSVARYAEILSRTDANNPDSIVGNTLVAIENFTSGAEQSDDITILALKFHGASEGRLMAEQQIVIKNELSELIAVNEKFENFSQESDIPQEVSLKFNIIFDEILSNVISYAYNDDDEHDIEIRMERAGKRVTVTITDDGVPFNPLSEKKPNTDLSLEDREIGGLGIHLVRNLVDDVSYQRRIGKNVMTMMRNLELNDETP
jgi:sigma-B regulation protein RsbU (phosphoserine phosphatase)